MKKVSLFLAIGIAASVTVHAQSHGHLNIGAVDSLPGNPLTFDNASIFETNSGFIQTLTFTNANKYAGYFAGNITLTGLAGTSGHAGPVPGAAALGTMIYAQIASVEGPAGGSFAFWETGATNPTISLPSGTTSTNLFIISENTGAPGADPYGHIHGRQFTATKAGIYLVGFRAWDLSTNGVGGTPLHPPSSVLKFYFQAGVNVASITRSDALANITFGAPGGKNCTLQYTSSLSSTNWIDIGDPLVGNDSLQTLVDIDATNSARFYRIKVQ